MSTSHINLKAVCQALRMSKRDVYSRAGRDDTFPAMIRLPNGGGIVFEQAEIDAWARANPPPWSLPNQSSRFT
jgi:predicted DNA-binding transcriptional regulator AlpA